MRLRPRSGLRSRLRSSSHDEVDPIRCTGRMEAPMPQATDSRREPDSDPESFRGIHTGNEDFETQEGAQGR